MDSKEIPLEISVTEAKRLLDEEACTALLIDVREPYETEICRVKGAELIPMRQIPERMHDLPRDEHLLILCHVGARSMRVTEFLRAQGFTAVSNVAGGIAAWTDQIDPTLQRY
jgi:adenylyltransferase/sulfurtransferase